MLYSLLLKRSKLFSQIKKVQVITMLQLMKKCQVAIVLSYISSICYFHKYRNICEIDASDQDSNFFHVGCIRPYAALPPTVEDIKEKGEGIKRTLQLNENEIEIVEKRTRLQSKNCDWFLYRKGRITASKCKRLAPLKPATSPSKTLELLMVNKVPQTYAMLQGLEEEDAIDKTEEEGNHNFNFIRCGFLFVRLVA